MIATGYWHTADPYAIIALGLVICACMIYGATRGGR